jgi:II/X family phage/plasmid replication protein
MHSPATFFRHKKLLKEFGINIDLKPQSTQKTNVVPLIKILEAKPAQIPQWAFEQNLIHASASNY